jgi:hypothetical protein
MCGGVGYQSSVAYMVQLGISKKEFSLKVLDPIYSRTYITEFANAELHPIIKEYLLSR